MRTEITINIWAFVAIILLSLSLPWMFIPNRATDTPDCVEKEAYKERLANLDSLARNVQSEYPDYDQEKVGTNEEAYPADVHTAFTSLQSAIERVKVKIDLPSSAKTKLYKRKRGMKKASRNIERLAKELVRAVEAYQELAAYDVVKKEALPALKKAVDDQGRARRNNSLFEKQ